ncbi:tRNA-dihydrouridine synthase family protein, partial [Alcanivorax sp.]
MKLILAPMEGLADFWVRQALTDVGDYDWCVSEFVRVSGLLLPPKVFYRWCPELKLGARTRAGTPVHLQLLGSDPACMADNAERAVELGAPAIDLNFGCPAKTVNRHRGGAVLLDEPDVVHAVTAAVRQAVPSQVPVSVKMRLGNEDDARALDNARAVVDAGAAWLTVHGRTKRQGYKPPAFWDRIGHIREVVSIPVIANGEIWTPDDAGRAQRESGCEDLMLGRGAVANPLLVSLLRFGGETNWDAILPILQQFWMDVADTGTDAQLAGRIKQWLSYLRRRWPQA